MSKVINDEGIKPGCIYRIALENFVTYKKVVLHPGPSLNMIIGPNGTGKSTFVCAIILGLCGKTSVIGRAKKISEYVRSGCEQASIEIELYQQPGKRNVIITRYFNLADVTTWSIDNKTVRERQVQDLIASLNIQVDNLCQLLPQDRVQDFSKMDPQQLLRSTLSAVGGVESVQQLDELIESRKQQRGLSTKVTNNAQLLAEQTQLNDRLKLIIDAMEQRKELKNQIKICEKKKLWLEYQDLREKVIAHTNDKKQSVKLVTAHQMKVDPLQKIIDKAKSGISKLEQQKLNDTREIHSLKDKAKDLLNSVRNHEYSLKDIEASFQEKMQRHVNWEQELVEAKLRMEKLVTDRDMLVEKIGDNANVKMDLDNIVRSIAKCNAGLDSLKKQKLEIQYDLENNIVPQIRLYQNRIRNLQDVDVKRLETLRTYSEDCYKAVMWLRENKGMFQHPVHEPMMLEINFTDPKFARYLESTVPARDLVAFTFESSADMNLFLQKVRTEGGLKRVNAICSQGGQFIVQTNNIQQLSYLGFHTYLADALSAPDAIVRYLCKQYAVHKIPIGNEHTYNNSGRVPANITFFYTENHRFSIRVSAYSGAKSSSTIEIRPARLLANSVDVDQLENFTQKLSNYEKKAVGHRSRIQGLDQKISGFEDNINEFNTRRKMINDDLEKIRTLTVQARLQKQKVMDIESEPEFDVDVERARCDEQRRECTRLQCRAHGELSRVLARLQRTEFHGGLLKLFIAVSPQFAAFAVGGAITYPGVLLQQLNGNSSSIQLDMDTASWIGSIHGLAGLPAILMPTIMQWRGRRFAFLAACLINIIGWILAYTATNIKTILISESFHGLGNNSIMAVSLLSLSELVAPKFRNISMIAFLLIQSLGISSTGITARYLHYRTISIIMGTTMTISLLSALLWPQSPSWLAYKGEFVKCEEAFKWLRGTDDASKKELEELIAAQTENRIRRRSGAVKSKWKTFNRKDFYLPTVFILILLSLMYWSGTVVITIYGSEIIYKSTGSKELAADGYMMVNIALFTGITSANILIKYFNNKSVLLLSVLGTIFFLLSSSIVAHLKTTGSVQNDSLIVYCIVCYMLCNSLGINTIVFTMAAELMPVKHRGIGGALFIIFSSVLHSSSLKLAPYMFLSLGLSGTFLIYTGNTILCGVLIWKYVPETKGRTLQEIEDYYCNLRFEKRVASCTREPML